MTVSLTIVISESARKHLGVVLPHSRTVRSTLCVATGLPDSSRCERDWPLQASTPLQTRFCHTTDMARATSTFLCCCSLDALPRLRLLHHSRREISLSDRLSSLRRNTAVRLKFHVARQFCTPS